MHLMNINHMHVTGAIILVEEWMERMVREYSFFKLNATFLSLSLYIYILPLLKIYNKFINLEIEVETNWKKKFGELKVIS